MIRLIRTLSRQRTAGYTEEIECIYAQPTLSPLKLKKGDKCIMEVELKKIDSSSRCSMNSKNFNSYENLKSFVVKEETIVDSVLDYQLTSLDKEIKKEDETSISIEDSLLSKDSQDGDRDIKPFAFVYCKPFSDNNDSITNNSLDEEFTVERGKSTSEETTESSDFTNALSKVSYARNHFECMKCDKLYLSEEILAQHIKDQPNCSKDSRQEALECTVCGRLSRNRYSLQRHLYTHSRPFNCKICGQLFSEPCRLTRHYLRCSGVNRSRFNGVCRELDRKTTPTVHPQTSKESFSCDICGESFSNKFVLFRHSYVRHSRSEWFSCRYCGRVFNQRSTLTDHLQSCQRVQVQ